MATELSREALEKIIEVARLMIQENLPYVDATARVGVSWSIRTFGVNINRALLSQFAVSTSSRTILIQAARTVGGECLAAVTAEALATATALVPATSLVPTTTGMGRRAITTSLLLTAATVAGAILLRLISLGRSNNQTAQQDPATQQDPQNNDPVLDKPFDQPMYLLYLEEHGIYDAPYKVVDKRLHLHWQQADENNHVMIPASDGEYHYRAFNRGGPFKSLREVHSALDSVSPAEKANASFELPK